MNYRNNLLFLSVLIAALCSVASAGLVAHWKFDETTGSTAMDSSSFKNNGTIVGTAKWVPGKIGGALEFDGNTYVNCGNTPSLNIRERITISFWFKVQAFSNTWEAFLAKGDGAYRSSRSGGTGNATHMGVTGGNYFDAPTIVTDNQWHHWAGTYDGTTAKIYLDGTLDAQATYGGQIGDSSSYNLYIGENSQATGRMLHGLMDDVRLYDKVLSEQQIQDLIVNGVEPAWVKAEKPNPADGMVGAGVPLLQWAKGETAMFHNVYLSTSPDLTEADLKASRIPMTLYYHIPGFEPGATYFWRVDEIEKDGVTTHGGDVWTFVAQAVTAYYPTPVNKANTPSPTPTLTWMPGVGAVKHQVFFGDSFDAVSQGAPETDKGTFAVAETSFEPGTLGTLKTYYWRVDETGMNAEVKTGPVWSFTTALPVDDFESYTDDEGGRIYETWIDGWTNSTGSQVGYEQAPFAEQTIVHEGLQSMPLEYNNVDSPFYSEAELEFAPAEDWTANSVDTLVLFIQGRRTNDAGRLYIGVQDASGNAGEVAHPDPAILTSTRWSEWKIPVSTFADAGVNTARVKKLFVGVGNKADPQPGGQGLLYVDDIRLAKPAPVE